MIIHKTVAVMVPKGIDRLGFLRSPERPTPAVIPVNAGKTIANTIKKSLILRNEPEKNLGSLVWE